MNTIKCKDCAHFDERFKFVQKVQRDGTIVNVQKPLWYGHCTAQSLYPAKEQDGQLFPLNVRRRDLDDKRLAEMESVDKEKVKTHCVLALKKSA